ncbi:MAG TPA: hypothetical protein PLW35_04165 [Verrucomicrobiota bacterium]|nr:hypothetical protein [Verrucomicrobiota bacterium]HOK76900.1 hypothetical protein [Verrucomicrobiota bacterium]
MISIQKVHAPKFDVADRILFQPRARVNMPTSEIRITPVEFQGSKVLIFDIQIHVCSVAT